MNPRINVGKGVTGAVRYVLGEGRDPKTGELKDLPEDGKARVDWIGGTGFGWKIETREDADLARRVMEFDAFNQKGQCKQDCVHLSLAWRPGEQPTREQMEEAARGALTALGMSNAKALFVAHNDEDYYHLHIVASKINPDTGRAYDLAKSWRTLSKWAEAYERDHGGIISTRRETANELRAAIADRDAGAVLDALTKQRSTFTGAQLEKALAKEIRDPIGRAQFGNQILELAVPLSDRLDGPTTRYTTRAVLEAELHVLRAADGLAHNNQHGISDEQRFAVLNSSKFDGITREQANAFRHACGAEGLAIIDGQAGTGKSYTIAAVREAYEHAGYRVIGLGPTNAVAQDMRGDGFSHAATIHSELFALNNGRTSWNNRTVIVVDEAAMLDTKLMAMVTAHAHDAGAKLILVGDDRQLSSIDRGGMFGALKDRHGAAALTEVKRQHKIDDRRAAEMMAEGNFTDALNIYESKGTIHWTRTQGEARAELVEQWAKDSAGQPDKTRFVFAYTNDDVQQLNAALRDIRKQRGKLGEDRELATTHGRFAFATGDRIQFTATDKKAGIFNGAAGTIEAIDGTHLAVKLDGRQGKVINFDAVNFDHFRHGYAGTIYRGQGRTLDQSYLYHSEHWRSAASYVALTRHRDKTELFVARNTARDINQLARQMARTDDRRAASMFYQQQPIGPVRPLTAAEILASFGDKRIEKQQQQDEQARRRGPDMGYSHGGYAEQSRAALREHTRQQRRPRQEGKSQMDYDQDDEEKRKRSSAGISIDNFAAMPQRGAANQNTPEPMTREAIQRDPWNAVMLDIKTASPEIVGFASVVAFAVASHCEDMAINASGQSERDDWLRLAEVASERAEEARRTISGQEWKPEGPMTVEAIERDPRLALKLDLPHDASRELLSRVAEAVGDFREDFQQRIREARSPALKGAYAGLDDLARARQEEVEQLLHHQPAEPMTVEAIQQDPWKAVDLDIPANASRELLGVIADTAHDLRIDAQEQATVAVSTEEKDYWDGMAQLADLRFDEAVMKIHDERAREAWQEPAFSEETIKGDAWTAVHLPIPEGASRALLEDAHYWAEGLRQSVEPERNQNARNAFEDGPRWSGEKQFSREENFAAAGARLEALDARLARMDILDMLDNRQRDEWKLVHGAYGVEELPSQLDARHAAELADIEKRLDLVQPLRGEFSSLDEFMRATETISRGKPTAQPQPAEPMTVEAIQQDPWKAVDLPIPADADRVLLAAVASSADQCAASAFAATQVAEIDDPEHSRDHLARSLAAGDRSVEARQQLAALPPDELTLDDIAERVQQLIDDPTREADETDARILQALQDRREQQQTAQPEAAEGIRAREDREAQSSSQEPALTSSAASESDAIDSAFADQEMTDDKQVQYSRWTGERLTPTTGPTQEAGQTQGGGQGRTR